MIPQISIIVPWCNRPNIGRMLEQNSSSFRRANAEVLLVNFGGEQTRLRQLLGDSPPAFLRVLDIDFQGFNKCCAQNLGVEASRAERLFLLDEDIVLQEDTLDAALDVLERRRCFVTVQRVDESEPAERHSPVLESVAFSTEFRAPGGRRVAIETNATYLQSGARAGPGLACMEKADFLRIKGTNSMIHGRGWGDIDLIARLQFALDLERVQLGRATHFSHSTHEPWAYDDRTRAQSEPDNYLRCLENYANGRFMGTYAIDLDRWKAKVR